MIFELENVGSNNRASIQDETPCGCYYCSWRFKGKEITKWVDEGQTAICPYCECDSVVAGEGEQISKGYLKALHKKWFSPVRAGG